MVRLNLSSQIVLNKIPQELYNPKNILERSEITRMEKITTDIHVSIEEGATSIANGNHSRQGERRKVLRHGLGNRHIAPSRLRRVGEKT